ncbi:MAG: DNA-binding protein [Halobacteriales archaeon SW_8_66_22]|jgi:hypothetical protein|nr:MAG: DNA-binding protein [Halobacteriales archaeon SW_8_66_22]
MRRSVRLGAVAVALALALGLCVHYGATYDENWPYPTGEQLAEEPGGWDGEQVLLVGVVETVGEDGFTMTVETDDGEVARLVEVRGRSTDAEPGGTVQVYGELSEEGAVLAADRVVVVVESPDEQFSKYAVSAAALLLVAGAFLRHWRIDLRRLAITARGDRDE